MQRAKPEIRKDIVVAIKRVWPDGVIEMPADAEEIYFQDIYEKLKSDLSRVQGAMLTWERGASEIPRWDDESDEEPAELPEGSRSYHVFFLTPSGEGFKYETDTLEPDENGVEQRYAGEGTIGCVAGVSLLAPVAAVMRDQLEHYENGGYAEPDIEPHIFPVGVEDPYLDEHYKEILGVEDLRILDDLQTRVAAVLEKHGLTVLPREELRKPVPWLRASEEVLVDPERITVREAFFFKEV